MKPPLNTCTECNEENVKIHRNYKNRRFCGKCYFKYFKLDECPKCHQIARLPTFNLNPVCIKCERNKPCIRCGKKEFNVGKITEYGPVCNACSKFYRDEQECQICGTFHREVFRRSKLKHNLRVCNKCYRDLLYSTCPRCHRHRILVKDDDNNLVCELCATVKEIKCSVCGEMKPAGYGKRCQDCYWKQLLEKRVKINNKSFKSQEMAHNYSTFSKWLEIRKGTNFAAILINKFLPFFNEIEETWGDIPDYPKLLKHFTANRLRMVRLPMFWLEDEKGLVVDKKLKLDFTELMRTKKLRDSFAEGTISSKLITEYYEYLMKKNLEAKIKILSVRLALTPAVRLLKSLSNNGNSLPTQKKVEEYLISAPGQKAAITGFLVFINKRTGTSLRPIINEELKRKIHREKLEGEILSLMNNPENTQSFKEIWTIKCLEYFHNFSKEEATKICMKAICLHAKNGLIINWNSYNYFIPPLAKF